jgi:hypothetical protein
MAKRAYPLAKVYGLVAMSWHTNRARGVFMVAGETIRLPSKMK